MLARAGAYLLAHEFALRRKEAQRDGQRDSMAHTHTLRGSNPMGVQHVVVNSGFTQQEGLQRFIPEVARGLMGAVLKGPEYTAYTLLYAGLGPDVRSGDFVIPWGRKGSVPAHVEESTKVKDGETMSVSARFFEWCREETNPFV